MGQNDKAWEELFKKYHILEEVAQNGEFVISASQIKDFREPRLMTKFDHHQNLPFIFRKNRLAILPITRGDYMIAPFQAYHRLENVPYITKRVQLPAHLKSISSESLSSESFALNCAYACGILSDFLEDDDLVPTVSGRMSSGCFDFFINCADGKQHKVSVQKIPDRNRRGL